MDKDDDLNSGVQIILNRMKSHPEEFFDDAGRWKWIFKDTLREVMTEIEKAALYDGLKQVRRLELTSKAAATVLRADEQIEKDQEAMRIGSNGSFGIGTAPVKAAGGPVNYGGNSLWINTDHSVTQKATITLGQEQINEDDIRELKSMANQRMLKEFK